MNEKNAKPARSHPIPNKVDCIPVPAKDIAKAILKATERNIENGKRT